MLEWKVNGYSAAVCISAAEINRKLKSVFDTTPDGPQSTGLPKTYKAEERPAKDDGTFDPEGVPRWMIDVTFDAPYVDFETSLKQGVRLHLPMKSGIFRHLEVKTKWVSENGKKTIKTITEWPELPLAGLELIIETPLKSVEHRAAAGETVDEHFTVQSVYVDLQHKDLLRTIATSKDAKVKKTDGTSSSVANVIMDHIKDNRLYNESFVIGLVRIPKVAATTGDLAPVAMRYSVFQETTPAKGQSAKRGCLSWNLALKNETLPNSSNEKLGLFSTYPIGDGVPGILLVSWRTIIERIILDKLLTSFGLSGGNFTLSDQIVKATLNGHVAWKMHAKVEKDTRQVDGKITNVLIKPSLTGDGVEVDFKLEQIKQHPSQDDWDAYNSRQLTKSMMRGLHSESEIGGGVEMPPSPTDPTTVTWGSLFKFKIDSSGKLTIDHSMVRNLNSENETGVGWRVLRGIFSLFLSELIRQLEGDMIDRTMRRAFDPDAQLAELLKTIELPGKAVFKFSAVKATDDGLVFNLTYA